MHLFYDGKKSEDAIIEATEKCILHTIKGNSKNKLIFGENSHVLKALLEDYDLKKKVDLIYIDPPFATKNNFMIGKDRVSTISSSHQDEIAYSDTLTGSYFIEFLRERLVLLRELMSEKAAIYLHIDYKIGHYVKVIMDEIFGSNNFKNDITRIKCNPKNFDRKSYGNVKDLVLFYTKSSNPTWNDPRLDFSTEDITKLFKKVDKGGRRYTTIPLHAPGETRNGATGKPWRGINPPKGRHWRSEPKILDKLDEAGLIEWSSNGVPRKIIYADEQKGKKMQDIWDYKDAQYPSYPTEKNFDMLKNIIKASSNEGDLVLDCFCGSGTTLHAAQELGRNWIGIDQSLHAIKVAEDRLLSNSNLFSQSMDYELLVKKAAHEKQKLRPLVTV